MRFLGEAMSSVEAGAYLGVSVRQVQRLVDDGALERVGVVGRSSLIDASSVQRLKQQGSRRGRPWSARTIAAALDILSDGDTERLSSVERGRLRKRLKDMEAADLVRSMRQRASVTRFRASASFIDDITDAVHLTGEAALAHDSKLGPVFGLAAGASDGVDGYVDAKGAAQIIRSCHLVEDVQGNVTLRITAIDALLGDDLSPVVVAVDLAGSLATRQRSAGLAYLTERLRSVT